MTVSTLVIFQDKSMEKNAACPSCGKKGRMVKPLTVESLLTEEARSRVIRADGFRFCAEPSCNVAYFHPETGDRFLRSEVRVRIGQKETAPPRPICYCFNHTVEEIESELAKTGTSHISDEITQRCRQGLDRCEETNPQGICCLGAVRQVLLAAQAKRAGVNPVPVGSQEVNCTAPGLKPNSQCCCPPGDSKSFSLK